MKKIILATAAIFSIASAVVPDIAISTKDFKIIPDVVPRKVPELLKITFDSGASVNMGNVILPSEARNQPKVEWNADKNAYYTIMCFDADAPTPRNPFLSQLITWMVGNIPGNNIDSGDVLTAYIPVSPPRRTQLHRSIFLLFKQQSKQQFDENRIDNKTIKGRAKFLLKEFLKKYKLGEAVAGNFYNTKFDSHVLEVYKTLNCCGQYHKQEE